jgi:hypothetical protein
LAGNFVNVFLEQVQTAGNQQRKHRPIKARLPHFLGCLLIVSMQKYSDLFTGRSGLQPKMSRSVKTVEALQDVISIQVLFASFVGLFRLVTSVCIGCLTDILVSKFVSYSDIYILF